MVNSRRFDPYKSFKFRVAFAALGIAAFGVLKKLLGGAPASKRHKKVSGTRPIAELEAGARPIEAVGTSTAGFVGTAPKKRRKGRPAPSRGRRGPRKTKTGAS
jgi:hypothetical protein